MSKPEDETGEMVLYRFWDEQLGRWYAWKGKTFFRAIGFGRNSISHCYNYYKATPEDKFRARFTPHKFKANPVEESTDG